MNTHNAFAESRLLYKGLEKPDAQASAQAETKIAYDFAAAEAKAVKASQGAGKLRQKNYSHSLAETAKEIARKAGGSHNPRLNYDRSLRDQAKAYAEEKKGRGQQEFDAAYDEFWVNRPALVLERADAQKIQKVDGLLSKGAQQKLESVIVEEGKMQDALRAQDNQADPFTTDAPASEIQKIGSDKDQAEAQLLILGSQRKELEELSRLLVKINN